MISSIPQLRNSSSAFLWMLNRCIRGRHIYSSIRIKELQMKLEGGKLKTRNIGHKQFKWVQGETKKKEKKRKIR